MLHVSTRNYQCGYAAPKHCVICCQTPVDHLFREFCHWSFGITGPDHTVIMFEPGGMVITSSFSERRVLLSVNPTLFLGLAVPAQMADNKRRSVTGRIDECVQPTALNATYQSPANSKAASTTPSSTDEPWSCRSSNPLKLSIHSLTLFCTWTRRSACGRSRYFFFFLPQSFFAAVPQGAVADPAMMWRVEVSTVPEMLHIQELPAQTV